MKLNNLIKTNTKRIRPGRGIGCGKGKPLGEGIKDKSLDQVYQLKALKADRCLYLEDCQREVLNLLQKII